MSHNVRVETSWDSKEDMKARLQKDLAILAEVSTRYLRDGDVPTLIRMLEATDDVSRSAKRLLYRNYRENGVPKDVRAA